MQKTQFNRNKPIIRNLALYAAGAWATIEFIDFSVAKYGLNADLLDIAMFLAVIGTLAVIVLGWYHGEPGRQRIAATESVLLGALALIAAGGIFTIGTRDPFSEFNDADGFRLTVAFRTAPPGESSDCGFSMHTDEVLSSSDMKRLMQTNLLMSPSEFRLDIPGVQLFGEHLPVRFISPPDDELSRMIIVLPSMPEDLQSLLQRGVDHDLAQIESTNFVLQIDRALTIITQGDSATIRIKGPFALEGNLKCGITDDQ